MTDNRKLDGPVKYDFDFDEAMQRIIGASITQGAVSPSWRNAAMKVCVPQ